MNIRFWPSLQLIANVKIALVILRNFCTYIFSEEGCIELQCMNQILSSLHLPNVMKKRTKGVIRALCNEVENWWDCHEEYLLEADRDYWNRIRWYSHGTINKFETARAFIADENINIRQRFYLAYAYYLEEDAWILWEKMTDYDVFILKYYLTSRNVRPWLHSILLRVPLNWSIISQAALSENFHEFDSCDLFYTNPLGLSHAFPKLENPEARFQSISLTIKSEKIHRFDLFLCLTQMDDSELDCAFHRLMEKEKYAVILSFLYWPLQCIFKDIIERFRNNLSHSFYIELFTFILREKLESGCLDHDYVDLVKELWGPIPSNFKSKIKGNQIFQHLKPILGLNE
ncbi:uncharacterized protein NPIL_405651 [Nephila pilipes]|uniref:Uncharacterized protein n=1 Tax=Nephila pilipes TaxID=299642 RepID=A0A8X6TXH9_NEPPI|nr:uncharacterized protein NPIL_405651 [Nephila pilipes]